MGNTRVEKKKSSSSKSDKVHKSVKESVPAAIVTTKEVLSSKKKSKKSAPVVVAKEESSDSSDSSDSDSDEETVEATVAPAKDAESSSDEESSDEESVAAPADVAAAEGDSSDSSDSDSDAEEEVESAPVAEVAKPVTEETKEDSDDSSASASDSASGSDSDSSDDEAEAENEEPAANNKRAAEVAEPVVEKKQKVETPVAATEGASSTVRFGQLAWGVTDDSLRSAIEQGGLTPTSCRVIMDRETGRSRGLAFVAFSSPADAQTAVENFNEQELEGRTVRVSLAEDATPRAPNAGGAASRGFAEGPTNPPSNTLFVGNISWNSTEESLREAFAAHGDLVGLRMPTDMETGKFKGYAYVEYGSVDVAQTALNELKEVEIDGRNVRLDFATTRSNDGGNGGGRGGSFGGRGGARGGRGRGSFDRGGRGGGRGGARGGNTFNPNRGSIQQFQGQKMKFED